MARINGFRKANRGRRTLLLTAALLALAALQVGTSSAHVSTDQAEYAPGATVTISGDSSDGAGYIAGEAVHVDVSGPNDWTASCDATAGEGGSWACQVQLQNSELAAGDYTYTATGATSGVSESGAFSDAVDTYVDSAHAQVRHWFARGDTVYAGGTFAGTTRSYKFFVVDPTGTTVQTTACIARTGPANDSYTLPANAVLGATASWTYNFSEWAGVGCTGINRIGTQKFQVAQLYAFTNTTDRNACGGAAPGASWPTTPCAGAQTTFAAGATVYVRILGLEPGVLNVSTTWNKPTGPACANTSAGDRPDGNATDGRLDTAYPPPAGEIPDNAADCAPTNVEGDWTLTLADGVSRIRLLTLPAFTVRDQTPPVTTIVLDPAAPDNCCWYIFAVKPTVSATDNLSGVAETRCQLDGPPPATFDDLPPGMCPYLAPSSWITTDGIHTLYAASIDNAGNKEAIVSKTFKLDRTPPTSQVNPLPQFQPSPGAFTVSWMGTDNVSGIKDFDVRYRTAPAGGTFGAYTQWFTDTTLTSAPFTPTPGTTTCFSVRARDNACWEEAHYSPEVCTTAPYDDPSLTRTGSWTTVTGSGYFGPSVSRSTTYNNKLTLTGLRGSVIGVLVTKQPGGGPIELRWNGMTKLATSLSATTIQKKVLLTFTLPSVQTGTLDIIQTNYGTVDIDAAGAYKDS